MRNPRELFQQSLNKNDNNLKERVNNVEEIKIILKDQEYNPVKVLLNSGDAQKLIENGDIRSLAYGLKNFKDLDKNILYKLIENGFAEYVVKELSGFKDIDYIDLANKVIKTDTNFFREKAYGANNLVFFKNLNLDIANIIIEQGGYYSVMQYAYVFDKTVHSEILNNILDKIEIKQERFYALPDISHFEELSSEIAEKLINKSGNRKVDVMANIIKNLNSFQELNSDTASKIFRSLFNHKFNYDDRFSKEDLFKLKNLDPNIAVELIEQGNDDVISKMESFYDNSYIADKLIEIGKKEIVSKNLFYFKNLNSLIFNNLIDQGCGTSVIEHLDSFEKINSFDTNKLIDSGYAQDVAFILNENKFGLLDSSVANNLIDHKEGVAVLDNLNIFQGLKKQDIVDRLIETGEATSLINRIKELPDIEPETIEYLDKFIYKPDNEIIYKLRKEFPLQEIINNYENLRIKSWGQENILKQEDKDVFEKLKVFIDERTLGELWINNTKEELHIIGPQIFKIYELSGYNQDTFRGQYLERIIKDGANYGEQSTLRHFNYIIENLNTNSDSVLTEASSFESTKFLSEKLTKDGPFKNWETLKKYHELTEILKQREVLEKLENLKRQGKEKHYKFFSDLAFHPGSKISMQTVFEFMENPAHFLDVEDAHSGEAHQRKKPSNYTKFEYLDISAEDLRDALIEGTCDKLQYFKPFEANYKIADNNYSNQQIIKLLQEALGSFKEKIKGKAKNPGKLFQMTQEILKKHKIEYKDMVSNPLVLNTEVRNDLERILFDNNFGIKDNRRFEEYLVKIHPKSSPEGHLAGNDTACCMPFGSGKNNVYMYNLGCSILTVQRKVGDKYRTIAQSVLTPDVDIKHNIADLVNKVQDEALLSSVIDEDLTQKKKIIITADNIEVAPNAEKYKNSIEAIYADFVSRYASATDSNEIEKNRMLVGKGYSDLYFSRAKNINNTFIPITPVAYSDNYGEEVYELPLSEKSEIIPLPNYGMIQKQEKELADKDLPKGVSYLTAHDTLRVSYMEGKVYAENESLIQYIHRMGNELTAKDINNNFKGRPNLSLKIEDEKNTMLGYMIAYEGAEKNYDDESEQEFEQKVIYISDIAVDTSRSKLSGGKLIKAFETLVKREYLEKENPLPIVAQARETTSYKIIQNHLNDMGKEYGYMFELEESGAYESGDDIMHQIKLIPIRI